MESLQRYSTPQLERLHSGKVRESFRVSDGTRLIVVTDRISAFDRVLETGIPGKGAVLNRLAAWWFERTEAVVGNHVVRVVDDQAMLVREAVPIRVEMIVRGYLTGSMWRKYAQGQRAFCGLTVPDGLSRNERFPAPLVTPTTKGEIDEEVSPDEIVRLGLADAVLWERMRSASLELFRLGTERLAEKGLLLVDTKYEFGIIDGEVVLIDEIHTPDSSRFWDREEYARDRQSVEAWAKEYVRAWLLEEKAAGRSPVGLPPEVVEETSRRYLELFERVTGDRLALPHGAPAERLHDGLVREGLVRPGTVAIAAVVENHGVAVQLRVASAHKTPEAVAALCQEYNECGEPGAVIAVAGLSNGLGGALAANLAWPVISCPPFKDSGELGLNIHSSLMLPSQTPAMTVVRPENAALAALRCLNIPALRARFVKDMNRNRSALDDADRRLRRG